jgi:chemotaxis protein methyltransferase CheR
MLLTHKAEPQTQHKDAQEFAFSVQDMQRVQLLMKQYSGIKLASRKQQMVYNRLSKRLRALRLSDFGAYLQMVKRDPREQEIFVNALTTNLTAFFREQHHFDLLETTIKAQSQPLSIWSAGCSSGEEPYSIAMTACMAAKTYTPAVNIVATDINSDMLKQAQNGIYPAEAINKIPFSVRKQFFMKGKNKRHGEVKVCPQLRALVEFRTLNLATGQLGQSARFDMVFCRNVLIYFSREKTHLILQNILSHLKEGGLLFVGHAENYNDYRDVLQPLGNTVYRKRSALHE